MSWLQLRLGAVRAEAETLESALLAAGALAVTLEDLADQPLLEPGVGETPLWDAIQLSGLFPAGQDMDAVLAALAPDLPAHADPRIEILEDKDWSREWMRHYRPMRFGARLWVCPSWISPPEPEAVNLLLDPGLAFGTGTHPTTALCLRALDALELAGTRVVDYGCGSGILAVAAGLLGAGSLLCVDNDPQALAATRDNAARNGLDAHMLEVGLPGAEAQHAWQGSADVVVANILAGPLLALAPTLCGLLRPGGQLLLSGLLLSQAEALIAGYRPLLELRVHSEHEGWVCLHGQRPAAPAR